MISIIICTRYLEKIEGINANISNTINTEYEIITIDNSKNQYSIFQAYNLGVSRSKYDILCFMHDDIVYHSQDWGLRVIEHFKNPEIGIIGVSGTRYLSRIPTIWWAGGEKYAHSSSGTLCINCIQTNRQNPTATLHTNYYPKDKSEIQVAVLDGLWFCIPSRLFDKIKFDENAFSGFHFYDLDICMQINELKLKIFFVSNILIEHLSYSLHNKTWLDNCYIFYEKWKYSLPLKKVKISIWHTIYIKIKGFKLLLNFHTQNKILFSIARFLKSIC